MTQIINNYAYTLYYTYCIYLKFYNFIIDSYIICYAYLLDFNMYVPFYQTSGI